MLQVSFWNCAMRLFIKCYICWRILNGEIKRFKRNIESNAIKGKKEKKKERKHCYFSSFNINVQIFLRHEYSFFSPTFLLIFEKYLRQKTKFFYFPISTYIYISNKPWNIIHCTIIYIYPQSYTGAIYRLLAPLGYLIGLTVAKRKKKKKRNSSKKSKQLLKLTKNELFEFLVKNNYKIFYDKSKIKNISV